MRFTPAKACNLKSGKIFSRAVARADTTRCTLYVWDDAGGNPGTLRTQKNYIPSTRDWDIITLDSPIEFSGDFWIGYRIPM
ncbi:MAG: hypothetical protein PHE49_11420 [bacterium]|nr:hypothetical protein [bacterium]